jgi:DNA-binding IclR family transcriptional regulator
VQSVAKAMQVLHTFTPLASVLSVRQLSERTSIPRSTVHALCATLTDAGMLEEVPAQGYRLGGALVDLGGQVIDRTGLVEAAEGVLERLRPTDGTEAHLGQLVGGWIVYLSRSSGYLRAPMNNRVGLKVGAHLTGCGRAALAALTDDDAARRVARSCAADRTDPPDPAALTADLTEIRRRRYVLSQGFQSGRASVAAAIVDPRGVAIGGVSIAGPASMFSSGFIRETAPVVVRAAATIGERLPRRGT